MKKIVLIVAFTAMMILTFLQNDYSIEWIRIAVNVVSTTGTVVSIGYFLWDKYFWVIPSKRQWKWFRKPFLKGRYCVELDWGKFGKSSQNVKKTASIIVNQTADSLSISLDSSTGQSKSGKVDIVPTPFGYELYYHYYMSPKSSSQMKTNPAHDGSAKIIIRNNKVESWEYWTARGTEGQINIISRQ